MLAHTFKYLSEEEFGLNKGETLQTSCCIISGSRPLRTSPFLSVTAQPSSDAVHVPAARGWDRYFVGSVLVLCNRDIFSSDSMVEEGSVQGKGCSQQKEDSCCRETQIKHVCSWRGAEHDPSA